MNIEIRRAVPEDAETLTEIAIAAKRHWNYPERWIQIWIPLLTFKPEDMSSSEIFAELVDGEMAGFYRLIKNPPRAVLEDLWVAPNFMGRGIGQTLFEHAISSCRSANVFAMELDADPNAQGFYEKMGMHKVGEKKTEVDGQPRILPIMEIKL